MALVFLQPRGLPSTNSDLRRAAPYASCSYVCASGHKVPILFGPPISMKQYYSSLPSCIKTRSSFSPTADPQTRTKRKSINQGRDIDISTLQFFPLEGLLLESLCQKSQKYDTQSAKSQRFPLSVIILALVLTNTLSPSRLSFGLGPERQPICARP
jgi:hypothetical protein